jgi:hypothetical protein
MSLRRWRGPSNFHLGLMRLESDPGFLAACGPPDQLNLFECLARTELTARKARYAQAISERVIAAEKMTYP